jgi:hypothetical protein
MSVVRGFGLGMQAVSQLYLFWATCDAVEQCVVCVYSLVGVGVGRRRRRVR